MFLALTADNRFWDTKQKILLLGEWCRLYDTNEALSSLNFEVAKYPWDDREKLYKDYRYLCGVYEKALKKLSDRLNLIHRVDHSLRYWTIVIGHWLWCFVAIFFERYICLKTAVDKYPVDNTCIIPETEYVVPNTFAHFAELFISDAYNMVLYSQLIRQLGGINYFTCEDDKGKKVEDRNCSRPFLLQTIRSVLKRSLVSVSCRLARANNIVMVATGIPFIENIHLHGKLRQYPIFGTPADDQSINRVNYTIRNKLKCDDAADEFERILFEVVVEHIPLSYVENYKINVMRGLKMLPKQPKMIMTATGLMGHDVFKIWTAEKIKEDVLLVVLQHGGQFGCGKWKSEEEREVNLADRYYSWGWENKDNKKIIPWFANKLVGRSEVRRKRTGKILWAIMGIQRYLFYVESMPAGPQNLSYVEDQRGFGKSVNESVRSLLLCRLFKQESGWREGLRLKKEFPKLDVYIGKKPLIDQLRECRLFIGTHNGTAYLEVLAANYPSILFWNPNHWELRPSAQPYFDDLRRVGILYDSPEKAAEKVNEIYEDPESWWQQPEIQEVQQRFCRQFARTSASWLEEWSSELRRLANGSMSVR